MKNKNEKFEKNISRLIKLTNDNNEPSENFIENLTNDALNQLSSPQSHGAVKMKPLYKRIIGIAAVLAVAALLSAIYIPSTKKAANLARYEKEPVNMNNPQISLKEEKLNITQSQIAKEMNMKTDNAADKVMRRELQSFHNLSSQGID